MDTLSSLVFYALAAATLVGALGVALSQNIIYSALSLLGALLGVAGLYVFLSADYLAVTQVLIYVGGVLVLILFSVMLTRRLDQPSQTNPSGNGFPAATIAGCMLGLFTFVAWKTPWKMAAEEMKDLDTTRMFGNILLKQDLLPFEAMSFLLLAALIGSVVIARQRMKVRA